MATQLKSITLKPDITQKFIHWATRERFNNHYNNNGLLGMKWQKMAAGFVVTSYYIPF